MAKPELDNFLLPIGVVHNHLSGTLVVVADCCVARNDHPGNQWVPGWKAVAEGTGGAVNALRLLDVSLTLDWDAIYPGAAGAEERHRYKTEDRRPTRPLPFAEFAGQLQHIA